MRKRNYDARNGEGSNPIWVHCDGYFTIATHHVISSVISPKSKPISGSLQTLNKKTTYKHLFLTTCKRLSVPKNYFFGEGSIFLIFLILESKVILRNVRLFT